MYEVEGQKNTLQRELEFQQGLQPWIQGEHLERLLFVVPSLSLGGNERWLTLLSDCLSERFRISFLLFSETIDQPTNCQKFVYLSRVDTLFSALLTTVRRALAIRAVVKKVRPVGILSSQLPSHAAVLIFQVLFGWRHKLRYALRLTYDPYEANTRYTTLLEKLATKLEPLLLFLGSFKGPILVPSNRIKEKLISQFPFRDAQVVTVYTCVNREKIYLLSKEKVMTWPKEPVIISIGRLTQQKGHDYLLRAFAKVRRRCPCCLMIIGEGELKNYLVTLAHRLRIDRDVIFLGKQINPYKFLKRSRLFVLSSLFEGVSNSLLEAMALGVPVVSTDCEGSVEVLKDKKSFGMLVPRGDVDALADAIYSMLTNPDLLDRYSKNGSLRAADFDIVKRKAEYISLFTKLFCTRSDG